MTLKEFFEEAKYLTNVYCLKANVKQELLIIIMQNSKMVNQCYWRIFKLWQHVNTPANERIKKFIYILRPIFLNLLFGCKYIDIKLLLNKITSIKEVKKNIISNFPKQKKLFT